tara:strand:+ start:1644 stop:1889 length:246 start_codon:yes stop_codon:yes gene_type:complete
MLFYFCAAISDMMEYFRRTLHIQGILTDKQQRPIRSLCRHPARCNDNLPSDLGIGAIGDVAEQALSRQFCHQTTPNVFFVH